MIHHIGDGPAITPERVVATLQARNCEIVSEVGKVLLAKVPTEDGYYLMNFPGLLMPEIELSKGVES